MRRSASIASSVERLAIEIRHLQRTEVLEAEEFFSEGQKGSSAMPHKRNPVLTENLTGLARMVRSAVTPAMENVALWHERDISHSSVERMIGPDATITLDFALARLTGVVDKLLVYPENMRKNLDRLGGLIHSQRVLLALTQKGVSREDAYRLVQRNAMPVWRGEGDFLTLLKADKDVARALTASRDWRRCSTSAITSSTSIRFSRACSARRRGGRRRRAEMQRRRAGNGNGNGNGGTMADLQAFWQAFPNLGCFCPRISKESFGDVGGFQGLTRDTNPTCPFRIFSPDCLLLDPLPTPWRRIPENLRREGSSAVSPARERLRRTLAGSGFIVEHQYRSREV